MDNRAATRMRVQPVTVMESSTQKSLLHRTCTQEQGISFPSGSASRFSYDFSPIPVHSQAASVMQRKLVINQSGDRYEQEADRISEHVMLMSESRPQRTLAGECPNCPMEQPDQAHERLQTKRVGSSSQGQVAAPPIVHEALASPGQPLEPTVRAFMEPRFGHDFSQVRVHTNAIAAQSAKAVNALAFTVGRNLVFARGQYMPGTARGRRLLAHELTHVIQQEGSYGIGLVQRAEVDDRSCAGLKDIESDIDAHVNQVIGGERKAMKQSGGEIFAPLLILHVMQQLGGRRAVSPIEDFIEGLPTSKRRLPAADLAGTKYSGAQNVNRFYGLQKLGVHVVGSTVKIHGICVGADKLGHFFDQGFDLLAVASKPGSTAADVENVNRGMEIGAFGLASTGVFSNADQAANNAGLRFYQALEKNPGTFTFQIKNFITNQWNEQANPSFYEANVGSVVWSNLLTGQWQGTFTPARRASPVRATFNLSATTTGDVTGTFELRVQRNPDKPKDVTIKNGKITQKTTSVSTTPPGGPTVTATPVSGISIEFEWERAELSGKGKLDSVNEQTLTGTLGPGAATTGSGTVNLKKV